MSNRSTKKNRRSTEEEESVRDFREFEEEINDFDGGTCLDSDIIIPPPPPVIQANTRFGQPRIIISHIVNENFKSYFGKVIVGPFHKSFSCVIGPNGSGKSNVIDSVLFVFGFKSSKIRGKDLSSLIHNASGRKIDKCTVRVHFAQIQDTQSGGYILLPNSSFVVSRTAFKDGSSYYKIDNKKVTFKEMTRHLRVYGIDLMYNRFLILQGDVEKISLMKPKKVNENDPPGMLEYIEDIIGTTRYKEPLAKLSAKLRAFQEERHLQLEQVKKFKSELDMLKTPMTLVVQYFETKNNIARLNNKKLQYLIYEKNKEVEKKQEKSQELDVVLRQHEENTKELDRERKELDKQLKEIKKNVNKLEEKYEGDCTVKNELERKLTNLEGKIPDLEAKHEQLQQDHASARTNLKQVQKSIEEKQTKKMEYESKLSEIGEQINKLRENVELAEANCNAEISAFDDAKGKYIMKKNKTYEILLEKRNLYDETQLDYDRLKSSFEDQSKKLSQFEDQYKSKCEELNSKQKRLEELSVENNAKCAELKSLRDGLSVKRDIEKEKCLQVENLHGKLKEQECTKRAFNTSNSTLKYIMNCKADGTIPGIIGRLGDLGAIDKKYDVAISMCCGLLDYIIVDTDDTSKKCINLLKRDNVGQCGFVSLNKLRDMSSFMRNKPNVPQAERLFDLIEIPNEKVRPAFYHALRDTLVVDNINIASKIAYYGSTKYRVVTLLGDLIEMDGSMSGGGKSRPICSKMGTSVQAPIENTEKLKQQLERSKIELCSFQSEINQCESLIRSNESRLEAVRKEMHDLDKTTQVLTGSIPKLKEEIVRLKNHVETLIPDPSALAEKQEKVEIAKKEMADIEKELSMWENKIKDTNSRTKDIREKNLKKPEKLLNQAVEEERSISNAKNTINNEIINLKRKMGQLTTKLNAMENVQDLQAKKEAIENEKLELRAQLKNITVKLCEYKEQLNANKSIVETKEKDFRQIEVQYNDLQRQKLHGKKEKEVVMNELKILQHNLGDLKNQIIKLKLEIIPDISDIPPDGGSSTEDNAQENNANVLNCLVTYTTEEIETFQINQLEGLIEEQTSALHALNPNLNVVDEYTNVKNKLFRERSKFQQICEKCNQYAQWYDDTKNKRISEFNVGFDIVAKKVKTFYQMLTLGGDADLELKDALNPFAEGIELSVRPPKKSWKKITKLSGGEKTLTSLTLVFALHDYRPTPFYFMDEIDAALDEVNSCIIGHYIKMKAKMAQFVVISLRSPMFSLAPRLIGIYKSDNSTNSSSIRNNPNANRQINGSLYGRHNEVIPEYDEVPYC